MESLKVPCFQYHDKDCTATIHVEPGSGQELLVRCQIRNRLYRLTPEERVRQAIIWFLTEGAEFATVLNQHLRFGVEERSLDVAGFMTGNPIDQQFCPNMTVVIIETKRYERDLKDDVAQLKTYLLRERCSYGLLFNARQAIWLEKLHESFGTDWSTEPLSDLRVVEQRIERATSDGLARLLHSRDDFTRANKGDFDALRRLISEFGADAGLTFNLSIRASGSLRSIQAFTMRVDAQDLVTYRARGVVSRNRQHLLREDFHAILALRPVN